MVQDYADKTGNQSNYLALSGQFSEGNESIKLQEFICKYSNRLSYSNVANLVKDMTGFSMVSSVHCCNMVQLKANDIVTSQAESMSGCQL